MSSLPAAEDELYSSLNIHKQINSLTENAEIMKLITFVMFSVSAN